MAFKLEKINEDKKNYKIVFMIKGSDEVFANTIRRLILEEVPVLAVEDLEIKSNSSALYDEMLALRLGLTPIKTDLSSYRLPQNQDEIDERSAQCTLQLKLKSSKKGYVYAEEAESADPKCKFIYPKMPLTKLLSKQKVDVTMFAVMGKGRDHAKWVPAWAFYKKEPIVKIGKVKDPRAVMKQCTDGVFTLSGNTLKLVPAKVNESNLLEYYAELDEGIILEHSDNLIFTLESWGQLSCRDLLMRSAEILVEKAEEMEGLI